MPDPTPETTAPTDAPGTDVDTTTPTTPAKRQKAKDQVDTVDQADSVDEPVAVPVAEYVRDAAHAVPLSGLLADQPELLDAQLTVEEWDEKLTEYLKSER